MGTVCSALDEGWYTRYAVDNLELWRSHIMLITVPKSAPGLATLRSFLHVAARLIPKQFARVVREQYRHTLFFAGAAYRPCSLIAIDYNGHRARQLTTVDAGQRRKPVAHHWIYRLPAFKARDRLTNSQPLIRRKLPAIDGM